MNEVKQQEANAYSGINSIVYHTVLNQSQYCSELVRTTAMLKKNSSISRAQKQTHIVGASGDFNDIRVDAIDVLKP